MTSELRRQRDEDRKHRSRNQLLEAATQVFSENGYHNTLISDIVSKAGVGQGTFYRHFESKYQIFESLLDLFIEKLFENFYEMSTHLPTNDVEYRNASLGAVTRLVQVIERNRGLSLLFLTEAQTIDARMNEKVSGIFDRFALLAQFYLDHAVEHGFARPCNSAVVSQSLVGIALRLINKWWKSGIPEMSVEDVIREVVDFAFTGFGISKDEKVRASGQ
jgi:AcrR family transcriptional regulator